MSWKSFGGIFGGGYGRSARHSQPSGRLAGVPQRFLELILQWLAIDASLFQDCMESFSGAALQTQIQEVFEFYAKSIQSFSLGRCQGWLSKRLGEGSCSGLLLLHPQLSVQLWGSYGEA